MPSIQLVCSEETRCPSGPAITKQENITYRSSTAYPLPVRILNPRGVSIEIVGWHGHSHWYDTIINIHQVGHVRLLDGLLDRLEMQTFRDLLAYMPRLQWKTCNVGLLFQVGCNSRDSPRSCFTDGDIGIPSWHYARSSLTYSNIGSLWRSRSFGGHERNEWGIWDQVSIINTACCQWSKSMYRTFQYQCLCSLEWS